MFTDDKNPFYSHYDIKTLFSTVNEELEILEGCFTANILLNIKKTKYIFFHKNSINDNIPMKISDLHLSNKYCIQRKSSIKFLGVMPDEHIRWNDHIHSIKKMLARNIRVLYRVRQILDKEPLKTIYLSHIHSYLNDANIAWASTYFT